MESPFFDQAIGLVIFANAVTIGLESSARVERWSDSITVPLTMLEHAFLCVYTIEVLLRFFVFSWQCLVDTWVKFDCFLVFIGVLSNWVLPSISFDAASLGPFMVLRLMRLLRLARTFKLIVTVRNLWLLVRSLLDSFGTMVYTVLLLLIMLYIFACISMELITLSPANIGPDPDPAFQELVDEYFPSLGITMVTLTQFVCFDSISSIYKPFIMIDPLAPLLAIYFSSAVVVIGIVLMNLITAVVVNSALEQAGKDKDALLHFEEKERKNLVKDLKKMFKRLDEDDSGHVTLDELSHIRRDDRASLTRAAGCSDLAEIFHAVDPDGNGAVSIDDFCDGIWAVSASQVPLEVKRTEKQVMMQRDQLKDLQHSLSLMNSGLSAALVSYLPLGRAEMPEALPKSGAPPEGFSAELSAQRNQLRRMEQRLAAVQDSLAELLAGRGVAGEGGHPGSLPTPGEFGSNGLPSSLPLTPRMPSWAQDLASCLEESVARAVRQELGGGPAGVEQPQRCARAAPMRGGEPPIWAAAMLSELQLLRSLCSREDSQRPTTPAYGRVLPLLPEAPFRAMCPGSSVAAGFNPVSASQVGCEASPRSSGPNIHR